VYNLSPLFYPTTVHQLMCDLRACAIAIDVCLLHKAELQTSPECGSMWDVDVAVAATVLGLCLLVLYRLARLADHCYARQLQAEISIT